MNPRKKVNENKTENLYFFQHSLSLDWRQYPNIFTSKLQRAQLELGNQDYKKYPPVKVRPLTPLPSSAAS